MQSAEAVISRVAGTSTHSMSTRLSALLLLGLGSHKEGTNPLLKFYYKKAPLFLACAGTELWYMSLYVMAWKDVQAVRILFYLCSPICLFKQVANVVQMCVAWEALVEHDGKTAATKKKSQSQRQRY